MELPEFNEDASICVYSNSMYCRCKQSKFNFYECDGTLEGKQNCKMYRTGFALETMEYRTCYDDNVALTDADMMHEQKKFKKAWRLYANQFGANDTCCDWDLDVNFM
jgi:hypothetical protein